MKGYVTVPLLNVRISAGGRIVGRVNEHELVDIFEINGEWTEIEYRGVPRLVMTKYLFIIDSKKQQYTGKVNVPKLNVRKTPEGKVVGVVKQNDTIYIIEDKNDWLRIPFLGEDAWVSKKYVTLSLINTQEITDKDEKTNTEDETSDKNENQAIENTVTATGVVTTTVLNVRSTPDGDVIGKLSRNDTINIISEDDGWYKFLFNNQIAYTSSKYVLPVQASITASSLNVRSTPDGEVIGKLVRGSKINIIENKDGWVRFMFNNRDAYVAAEYVKTESTAQSGGNTNNVPTPDNNRTNYFHSRTDLRKLQLEPASKLEITGTKEQKISASIYNQYGNLLQVLSKEMNIEIASAVAVLCVESGGRGFGSDGKMLIRFENHLFYNFWGKNNESTFDKHFKFNASKRWMDHFFRTKANADWVELHAANAQQREWEVLAFARTLDDTKALYSISMGAPQVMGFNHKIIGYDTVQEMFDKFNDHVYYHICALFDFCMDRPIRIKYLQDKNFVEFAREYNGPGQPQKYGD